MRKKLTLPLLSVFIFLCAFTQAQNQDYPWLAGFGTNVVDYNSTDPILKGLYDFQDVDMPFAISQLHIGRSLNNSFALGLAGSVNSIENRTGYDNKEFFSDVDLSLKYLFANGYLLKTSCWFDPYLLVGPGVSTFSRTSAFALNAGAGFNIWVSENFGLHFESILNSVSDDFVGDYFQHNVGVVMRFGKGKDSDNDGIPDKEDRCPTVAGLEAMNGCPDLDSDGITDAQDSCPDQKGLIAFSGCPDSDGDGITDKMDLCPTQAGLQSTSGCPDKDGDGIADKDDVCPDLAGMAQFAGCPDIDGDLISDNVDACPNEKGTKATNGCPDTDGDGIIDKEDACPTVAGIAENKGCPEVKEEVKKVLAMALAGLQFETGKDVIKKSSYKIMDNVVTVMKENPEYKLEISGHTDNVGDPKKNMDLSKRRAASAAKYLSSHGIDASRLSSEGYGDTKPVADNKTSAGRAKNRRVEFVVKF